VSVLERDIADGVALLTLNRPERRNALDSSLSLALLAALDEAEADDDVAAVVITGAGASWCAGLDIDEFNRTGRPPQGANEVIQRAGTLTKPAIGAINGYTMTGGLELALGLDFLIASEAAVFADTHARVGILPGGGMTARLPRAVGIRMARELSYTGRPIDAAEAYRLGLVNRVVAPERLVEESLELGRQIASRSAPVVRELKRLYAVGWDLTNREALAMEIAARDERRAAGRALVPTRTTPAQR
jgi:enoyl-CoA hydratase